VCMVTWSWWGGTELAFRGLKVEEQIVFDFLG